MADPPSPKQKWVLTPESFERLLLWLDHDRDRAGEKYEWIRCALIKRFRQLRSVDAEELANKTFDRVAKKLPGIIATFKGDPVPYFFSVAYFIYKEDLRKRRTLQLLDTEVVNNDPLVQDDVIDDDEPRYQCFKKCLEHQTEANRELLLQYYRGQGAVKIKLRKELAEQLGINMSTLRLRVQRAKASLKICIRKCMESQRSM